MAAARRLALPPSSPRWCALVAGLPSSRCAALTWQSCPGSPLRSSQLAYAAADVAYLIPLAEKLERELKKAKRTEWAQEEFEGLTRREWPEREFDKLGYLRVKGARALDMQALSLLRELYLMRDGRARELDRPAFKVLGNRTLLEIAQRSSARIPEVTRVVEELARGADGDAGDDGEGSA